MRKLLIISLLLIEFFARGQSIIKAEYFLDIDPGAGNGIPISVSAFDSVTQTFAINLNGKIGLHSLALRIKDNKGNWGFHKDVLFYAYDTSHQILLNPAEMIAAEYFIDTDPGIGKAFPLN